MVKRARTIVFDVSSHGFGHLGQIAPVIVELIAQHPTARVVVRSTHAASVVNNILGFHVDLDEPPPEATLVMLDPTAVDVAASAEAYRALHARWDEHLERETARLAALSAVVLVADVPYLSLAAAKCLGIPAVALCSLNLGRSVSHLLRLGARRSRNHPHNRSGLLFSSFIPSTSPTYADVRSFEPPVGWSYRTHRSGG